MREQIIAELDRLDALAREQNGVNHSDRTRSYSRGIAYAVTAITAVVANEPAEREALAVAVGAYIETHFAHGGVPGYLHVPDFIRAWKPATIEQDRVSPIDLGDGGTVDALAPKAQP
jgi:hypothetical protein